MKRVTYIYSYMHYLDAIINYYISEAPAITAALVLAAQRGHLLAHSSVAPDGPQALLRLAYIRTAGEASGCDAGMTGATQHPQGKEQLGPAWCSSRGSCGTGVWPQGMEASLCPSAGLPSSPAGVTTSVKAPLPSTHGVRYMSGTLKMSRAHKAADRATPYLRQVELHGRC